MRVSVQPLDNTSRKRHAIAWVTRMLQHSTLAAVELPRELRATIFIEDVPTQLEPGSWAMDTGVVYLGRTSHHVDQMTRLAILSVIANYTGVIDEPEIQTLISTRLIKAIQEATTTVYNGFIKSTVQPHKLAINTTEAQIAAELDGQWYLPQGTPIEVTPSWIIMDL